jgi:septum site-determining protein MinC
MEATNISAEVVPVADVMAAAPGAPAAILRGTARGLEVVVDGSSSVEAITSAVMKRLDEAPGFFRGSDVRIRVEDGPLPAGCLARLDEIAMMFELRIIEVTASKRVKDADAVPEPNLAAGSAPAPACDEPSAAPEVLEPAAAAEVVTQLAVSLAEDAASFEEPTHTAVPAHHPAEAAPSATAAPAPSAAPAESEVAPTTGTRIVVGPVRSGVILEHLGHLIIFGDVNPGAEVRASGNIVVLGRLRGTAHAGIGADAGFILALRLEPQQLRIGRRVARAADSDTPASEPEIAYGTGDNVVVERYLGKLPKNLATSL